MKRRLASLRCSEWQAGEIPAVIRVRSEVLEVLMIFNGRRRWPPTEQDKGVEFRAGTAEVLAADPETQSLLVAHLDGHAAAVEICRLAVTRVAATASTSARTTVSTPGRLA